MWNVMHVAPPKILWVEWTCLSPPLTVGGKILRSLGFKNSALKYDKAWERFVNFMKEWLAVWRWALRRRLHEVALLRSRGREIQGPITLVRLLAAQWMPPKTEFSYTSGSLVKSQKPKVKSATRLAALKRTRRHLHPWPISEASSTRASRSWSLISVRHCPYLSWGFRCAELKSLKYANLTQDGLGRVARESTLLSASGRWLPTNLDRTS